MIDLFLSIIYILHTCFYSMKEIFMKKLLLCSVVLLSHLAISMDKKKDITISQDPDTKNLIVETSENINTVEHPQGRAISRLNATTSLIMLHAQTGSLPETVQECKIRNITVINRVPAHILGEADIYRQYALRFIVSNHINPSIESTITFQEPETACSCPPDHGFRVVPIEINSYKLFLTHMYHGSLEDKIYPSTDELSTDKK